MTGPRRHAHGSSRRGVTTVSIDRASEGTALLLENQAPLAQDEKFNTIAASNDSIAAGHCWLCLEIAEYRYKRTKLLANAISDQKLRKPLATDFPIRRARPTKLLRRDGSHVEPCDSWGPHGAPWLGRRDWRVR